LERFWKEFGKVLERFWKGFGYIYKDFGKILFTKIYFKN
jgi:hypothetical protein